MMKSTDGFYVLRLPIHFMLEPSNERGNLKNIRNGKDTYSGVKNWCLWTYGNIETSCICVANVTQLDYEKFSCPRTH
jgi:hypothetical protein